MFVFVIVVSLLAGSSAHFRKDSAASEAQIRFAEENDYDSTGPGAKAPEYAYKVYKTLDEALIAYANDPDTKLPEYEKQRALQNLVQRNTYHVVTPVPRFLPKTVDEYTGYKPPQSQRQNQFNEPRDTYAFGLNDIKLLRNEEQTERPFRLHKYQTITGSSSSLDVHSRPQPVRYSQPESREDFDPNPQYTFSYGVHDKGTGDSKSAHETRDGGTVTGYYTFMDADGKQRTVHYTADDKLGFRATVQRTHTNTQ